MLNPDIEILIDNNCIAKLDHGDAINENGTWENYNTYIYHSILSPMIYNSDTIHEGNWIDSAYTTGHGDGTLVLGYMGFRILSSVDTLYGWVEVYSQIQTSQGAFIQCLSYGVEDLILSLEKEAISTGFVYSNPVNEVINIHSSFEGSICIYDMHGNLIIKTNHHHIDVSYLPSGTYLMMIRDKNDSISRKRIIKI